MQVWWAEETQKNIKNCNYSKLLTDSVYSYLYIACVYCVCVCVRAGGAAGGESVGRCVRAGASAEGLYSASLCGWRTGGEGRSCSSASRAGGWRQHRPKTGHPPTAEPRQRGLRPPIPLNQRSVRLNHIHWPTGAFVSFCSITIKIRITSWSLVSTCCFSVHQIIGRNVKKYGVCNAAFNVSSQLSS